MARETCGFGHMCSKEGGDIPDQIPQDLAEAQGVAIHDPLHLIWQRGKDNSGSAKHEPGHELRLTRSFSPAHLDKETVIGQTTTTSKADCEARCAFI